MYLFKTYAIFTITYILLALIVGFLKTYFGSDIHTGAPILIASIIYSVGKFIEDKKRDFTKLEKVFVIIGFLIIDICIQILSVVLSIDFKNLNFSELENIIQSIGLTFIFSLIIITAFVSLSKKMFKEYFEDKENEKEN